MIPLTVAGGRATGCRWLRACARPASGQAQCEWRARGLALSARDLLEPPQGLDVIVEVQDAVHGVQHHHAGAESTPAVGRGRPALRVRALHAQPALDAELGRIAPE